MKEISSPNKILLPKLIIDRNSCETPDLWYSKVHCYVHNTLPFFNVHSKINTSQNKIFIDLDFSIIVSSTFGS
jgi:hypothetical protein